MIEFFFNGAGGYVLSTTAIALVWTLIGTLVIGSLKSPSPRDLDSYTIAVFLWPLTWLIVMAVRLHRRRMRETPFPSARVVKGRPNPISDAERERRSERLREQWASGARSKLKNHSSTEK